MAKFKKNPFSQNSLTEEDFLKQATRPSNREKSEISPFLLRLPYATKRKLKHFSYVTERNMNQICLEAIELYLDQNSSKKESLS